VRFIVVADHQTRTLSNTLTRVFGQQGLTVELWNPNDFVWRRAEIGSGTRVLFVGNHNISQYLRKMIPTNYEEHGIRCGFMRRMAVVYLEDDVQNRRQTELVLLQRLEMLRDAPQATVSEINFETGLDKLSGKVLCKGFLNLDNRDRHPGGRAGKWEMRFRDLQVEVGIATFLFSSFDEWMQCDTTTPAPIRRSATNAFSATPLPSYASRSTGPQQEQHSAPFVAYTPPPVAVPNAGGTPVPLPSRSTGAPSVVGSTYTSEDRVRELSQRCKRLEYALGTMDKDNARLLVRLEEAKRRLAESESACAELESSLGDLSA
jgi:hypothetical protein